MIVKNEITILAAWWKEASYRVVFTGAGMSTESGLPDFRSSHGLWKNINPIKLASVAALYNNTEAFYDFYRMRLVKLKDAKPNEGHDILAKLQKNRLLNAIITQNVDGLHQESGAARVLELHGNLRNASCYKCGKKYKSEMIDNIKIPVCQCGGYIKPGVILFGEALPQEAFRQAEMETKRCNLFVVIGSSLEVSPANQFPLLAKDMGAKLVIINRDATIMDDRADMVIRGNSGEVLKELYFYIEKDRH